jgi:hypothetical protein
VQFNHNGQTDCQACHSPPGGHFQGQCSQCHSTNNWDAEFTHAGLTDCKSCHSPPGNEDHPAPVPQCSQCHSTEKWGDVNDD